MGVLGRSFGMSHLLEGINTQPTSKHTGTHTHTKHIRPPPAYPCRACLATGRYLYIRHPEAAGQHRILSLCEVRVFGNFPPAAGTVQFTMGVRGPAPASLSATVTDVSILDGGWHNVVARFTGHTIALSVDGVEGMPITAGGDAQFAPDDGCTGTMPQMDSMGTSGCHSLQAGAARGTARLGYQRLRQIVVFSTAQ